MKKYSWKMAIIEVFGLALFIIYMIPFYLMFINSFKSRREIIQDTTSLPDTWNSSNYTAAIEKMDFWSAFANSMIITFFSLIIIVFCSAMAAWVLVRSKTRVSKILFFIFIAAMIIPFQAVMLPLVKLMGMIDFTIFEFNFHMLRSHYGLIFMYLGFGCSMSIFLYHGFIKGIPIELEEAAIIDGCSKWKVFWKVVFPMLKPITVTVMVLNGIWIWNDFLLPSLTLGGSIPTIPLAMQMFFGQFTKQWELALAALTLAIIPVIIFYLIAQRHIIKGIIAGAIK
ncbi:MAG: carbohydrate ABC transporter permease [Bacillaceae bacterium]